MREPAFIWRLLTGPELTDVYLNEMRRDFPAGELKPLSMILNSEADGTAHTWGVFDGDTLAAYLLMVRPEGCRMSQPTALGRSCWRSCPPTRTPPRPF